VGPQAGAGTIVFTILLVVIMYLWPEIVKDYLLVCSLLARVASSSWSVVAFVMNIASWLELE
jgi:hypothetical protein